MDSNDYSSLDVSETEILNISDNINNTRTYNQFSFQNEETLSSNENIQYNSFNSFSNTSDNRIQSHSVRSNLPSNYNISFNSNSQRNSIFNHFPIPIQSQAPNSALTSEVILQSLTRPNLESLYNEIGNILKSFPHQENSGSFELLDVCTASQQLKYISAIHYLYFENMRLKLINRELCNNLPTQPSVNSVQISKESILGKHKSDIEGGSIIIKPKKPKNKENKEFKCNFPSCCKEFTKKSKLSRHFLTHNKNREKFFCNSENCKKSYFTKYDLVVHQKRKHEIPPSHIKCTFSKCNALLESKEEFHKHKILHLQSPDITLSDLVFSLSGTHYQKHSEISNEIRGHGAQFNSSVSFKVTHLVSTLEDLASESIQIKLARKYGIYIVSSGYLAKCLTTGKKEDETEFLLEPVNNDLPHSMKELIQESDSNSYFSSEHIDSST